MTINPEVEKQREKLILLRRYFHMHPEVSMQEYQTAGRIEEELDRLQIPHRRVGQTGVLGIIGQEGKEGKTVILRADIDALRIQDKKQVPYASTNPGVMHACGHDSHITALLGAAAALKKEETGGKILLFFQQGEEFGQGARIFIDEGLLTDADRFFGIHVASDIPIGKIGLSEGPVNASVDHFVIHVNGKRAHVSTPHLGVDALYVAAQIVNALQAIVSRQTSPTDTVVVGIGVLQAGDAYNVVAGSARLEGTTRCFHQKTREATNQKIREIAESIAAAYGAEVEITFEDFASPLVNDPVATNEVREVAGKIIGEENVIPKKPSLGGDDFAEYLLRVPGVYAYVGTANPDKPDTLAPQHADNYDIDEEAIMIAASLYVDYALYYLKEVP